MRQPNTAYERNTHPYPTKADEVVAYLATLCVEPVITPGMSEAEIMFLAGRRSVWRDAVAAYESTFAHPGDN